MSLRCSEKAIDKRYIVRPGAFTLIELLIVVAIISILAAIAVPNFLEAQTRAKVSRVKADMRSMVTAVESYHLDNNHYPPRENPIPRSAAPRRDNRIAQMKVITTPISYISALPVDVFQKIIPPPNDLIEYWSPAQTAWYYDAFFDPPGTLEAAATFKENDIGWRIFSVGPDGFQGVFATGLIATNESGWQNPALWPETLNSLNTAFWPYDPTNGTISAGNICATQRGGVGSSPQEMMNLFFNH